MAPPKPTRRRKGNPKRPAEPTPAEPSPKRIKKSPKQPQKSSGNAEKTRGKEDGLVAFWAEEGRWPEEWSHLGKSEETGRLSKVEDLISEGKFEEPSPNPSRDPSEMTASDRKPRELKGIAYASSRYPELLNSKGSYMSKSPLGITEESRKLCDTLLTSEQPVPTNTLFDDDIFERVCEGLETENEERVIQDVSRLLVPSVEQHFLRASGLNNTIDCVNKGWNNSVPLFGPRPQPDYSAGFRRDAFTEDQTSRLAPLFGAKYDQSFFRATVPMCFPFLTLEVKSCMTALEISDRQNAHSMTLAVRGVVELFRAVGREKELNREILAFSFSHNHNSVYMYAHYPIIDGKRTKYYRHPIKKLFYTEADGAEKWTTYKFTKNIYDKWVPGHFARLCSAIDQLPYLDFEVPTLSEISSHAGGSKKS